MPRSNPAQRIALQETADTIDAQSTPIGGIVPIGEYEWMTLLLEYVAGDETSVDIFPVYLDKADGIESQWSEWTEALGIHTRVAQRLRLTVTGAYEFTFNVQGHINAVIYNDANGGTPTGTLEVIAILKGNAGS